ncbi:MAG: hypothetical protein GEV07_24445 [Streptosporangiales bacterium]|nr:hypothetical protein [Streptosporangiales bacterium]
MYGSQPVSPESTPRVRGPNPHGIGGVLFAVLFLSSQTVAGMFATGAAPLPDAEAAEIAAYFARNQLAAGVLSTFHAVAALALLTFVRPVVAVVRDAAGTRRALPVVAAVGGVLAAVGLFVSAALGFALALFAPGWELGVVAAVRMTNFYTGGVVHVVSLGVFVGAAALATVRPAALPKGIRIYGWVAAIPAVLSVLSVPIYLASVLLPVGRILCLVWCVAAGVAVLVGVRRFAGVRTRPAAPPSPT